MNSDALWQRRLLFAGAAFYSFCCLAMATCPSVELCAQTRQILVAVFGASFIISGVSIFGSFLGNR